MSDLTSIRLQNTLGGNRRKKPFAFGLPMPDEEDTFDESGKNVSFGAENDISNLIKSIRPSKGLNADDLDPVYTRETEATERFRQLLDQFPERGEPSFLDKLAGAGAYLGNKSRGIPGGQEAAENAKYAGFNRELADWKEKTTPTYNAANLERYANATERQAVGQELRDKQATRAQTERERAALAKEELTQRKNEILQSTVEGYKYTVLGNKLIGHRPDGTTFEAGSASDYSPLELEKLRQTGRIAVVQERGTEARKTDAQRAAEALILEAQKDKADLEQARARTSAGKGDNQDELNKQRSEVIKRLALDNPDTFKKHIRQNTSTGEFELRARPVAGVWPWSDDPTEEQAEWDALNDLIYELVPPTPHLTSGQVVPGGSTQTPPPATQKPPTGPGFQFGPSTNPGFGGVTEGNLPPPSTFFPTPKLPTQPQSGPAVPPGEVLLRRLSDGGMIAVREENAQAMVDTGRYEWVAQ